jgi:hypothetical protein
VIQRKLEQETAGKPEINDPGAYGPLKKTPGQNDSIWKEPEDNWFVFGHS